MTHHKQTFGKVLDKLEPESIQVDSDSTTVLLCSLAISMKRIADYMDEIEYVTEPEKHHASS